MYIELGCGDSSVDECLQYKHEDLSLVPRTHIKVRHSFIPTVQIGKVTQIPPSSLANHSISVHEL